MEQSELKIYYIFLTGKSFHNLNDIMKEFHCDNIEC